MILFQGSWTLGDLWGNQAYLKDPSSVYRTKVAHHSNCWRLDSVCRSFSTQTATTGSTPQPPPPPLPPEKTHFGNLKDEDRIFTSLYGLNDPIWNQGFGHGQIH